MKTTSRTNEQKRQRALNVVTGIGIFTIALVIYLFATTAVNAQTFEAVKKGFDVESGEKTAEKITIDGKTFDVLKTAKGSKYVVLLSPRTGNHYPLWIGKDTGLKHDGRKVYQMKSGKYCIYVTSKKTGNPYAKWLKVKEE